MDAAVARLQSIALSVQNHDERTSAAPTPPKTNESATTGHLGWDERPNSSDVAHAEVVFAPAKRELLRRQIYASNYLSRNPCVLKQVQEFPFRFTIRFPVNIIQFRALAFRRSASIKRLSNLSYC